MIEVVEDAPYDPAALRSAAKRKAGRPRRKPEAEIVTEALTFLRSRGYARKVHGSAYGNVGEPDLDACVRGRAVKLEAKAAGEKPTGPQVAAMRRWAAAGALVGWFRDNEHIGQILDHLTEPGFVPDLSSPGCSCERHGIGAP